LEGTTAIAPALAIAKQDWLATMLPFVQFQRQERRAEVISHADLVWSLIAAAAAIGANILTYWQGWVLAPFRISRENDPSLFRVFFGIQIVLTAMMVGLALFLCVEAALHGVV
jgi:hypothetical protein